MSFRVGPYVAQVKPAAPAMPPDRMKLAPGDGVVIIGDSLAAGLQGMIAYPKEKTSAALPHDLAQKGVTLEGIAKGGTKAVHWKPAEPEIPAKGDKPAVPAKPAGYLNKGLVAALAKKPKAVIISLGTNDIFFARMKPAEFVEQLRLIARQIRAAGATPVFVGIPTAPVELSGNEQKRTSEKALLDAGRAGLIDIANDPAVRGVFIPPPAKIERWGSDPIHPNPAGNRMWATYITDHLT